MKKKIFAKKGEVVTCENGHPICVVFYTIAVADMFVPTLLGAWQQNEPMRGDENPVCAKCGALFWHGYQGQHFHFKNGWRDIPPQGRKRTWREKLKKYLR